MRGSLGTDQVGRGQLGAKQESDRGSKDQIGVGALEARWWDGALGVEYQTRDDVPYMGMGFQVGSR